MFTRNCFGTENLQWAVLTVNQKGESVELHMVIYDKGKIRRWVLTISSLNTPPREIENFVVPDKSWSPLALFPDGGDP